MFHYLKWAAILLFIKRNLLSLVLILAALVMIKVTDAVYNDIVGLLVKTGHEERLIAYLIGKWAAVISLMGVILFSIYRLVFVQSREKKKVKKAQEKERQAKARILEQIEAGADRFEKFKEPDRLASRAQAIIQHHQRKKP